MVKYKTNLFYKKIKILFFSFHFPPDQSAGASRALSLIKELLKNKKDLKIWVFCSVPKRYGKVKKNILSLSSKELERVRIIRFWIPYLGKGTMGSAISYSFYLLPAVICSLFLKPEIIISTSAKLFTGLAASVSSRLLNRKLFLDIRDTFTDNYFYFFRWKKRIFLISIFLILENIIIRSAYSINLVSNGFEEAYFGWENILKEKKISITYFTNAIERDFINNIKSQSKFKANNDGTFKVLYAGNLGDGQDLLSLLKDLKENHIITKKMIKKKIKFLIYGSGSQIDKIKKLLSNENFKENNLISNVVVYKGIVAKKDIRKVYNEVDCLMLHLGRFSSLSMVIPSKIFEYAATKLPIVFGAKGFTRSFIENIEGTIYFKQNSAESFYDSVTKSIKSNINQEKRKAFLSKYISSNIYQRYAQYILNN